MLLLAHDISMAGHIRTEISHCRCAAVCAASALGPVHGPVALQYLLYVTRSCGRGRARHVARESFAYGFDIIGGMARIHSDLSTIACCCQLASLPRIRVRCTISIQLYYYRQRHDVERSG